MPDPIYLSKPHLDAFEPISLLSNADATGAWVLIEHGGIYIWSVAGTFGSTTATLQSRGPDGTTAITGSDNAGTAIELTDAGDRSFFIPRNTYVRTKLSGGTPSGMYATLKKAF